MLKISTLHKDSTDRDSAEELYLTAFPEIERHPVEELLDACLTGKCEWFLFKDKDYPMESYMDTIYKV